MCVKIQITINKTRVGVGGWAERGNYNREK